MKAIRGATTVDCDSVVQIKERVKELLLKIKEENCLCDNEIVCIILSNTSDIRSYYPAKAAREAGFSFCPLFSALEPDIDGSLKKCIRVMVLTESDKKQKHIYLHGAAGLRLDLSKKINIAIDGPAGSGKSTVSKLIAKKMDILCLDTGAMYRACALKCSMENIDVANEKAVEKLIGKLNLEVKYESGVQHTYLDGADVSELIRSPEISMLASKVSALKCVRDKMVELQRNIASKYSCILDGRDIGTNVLPDAEFKFYLTASAEVRARRRFNENKTKNFAQSFKQILSEIEMRDNQDKNRAIAPLVQADDAVLVDTSEMSIEETVEYVLNKIQEKI